MRKVKAVVAGFEGRTMVVLTRDGQFKELPIPQYPPVLGEEIEIKERTQTKSFRPYLAAAAVLLLVLALGLFNPLASPVAAYVTLDINPGVELWIDRDAKVIKIKPLSDDAEKVISGISIKDKNLYETIFAIIDKSLTLGYLGKTHEKLVMVSVTPVKYQAEGSVDEVRLQEAILGQLKSYQIPGYLVVTKADYAQREQAQKKGLSVNKLLVYQKAEKRGINIPENAMIGQDMSQVLQELNLSVKDLFGQSAVEILNEQAKAQENVRKQDEHFPQTESRQDNRSNSSGNASPDNMSSWHESTRSGGGVTTDTTPVTTTKNPAGQAQPGENNQKDNTREIAYPKDIKQTPGDGNGTSQESSIDKYEINTGQLAPMEDNVKTPEKNSVLPNNQNQDKWNSTGNGGNTGGSSSGGSSGAGTGGGSSGSSGSGNSGSSSGSSGLGGGSWGSW